MSWFVFRKYNRRCSDLTIHKKTFFAEIVRYVRFAGMERRMKCCV